MSEGQRKKIIGKHKITCKFASLDMVKPSPRPHHTMKAFQIAVHNALEIYAQSFGCTVAEAREMFKTSESTRDSVMLLVLAQADKSKLKALAAKLS